MTVPRFFLRYITLPPHVSEFEERHLDRVTRIGFLFFLLHLPVFVAVAYFNETGAVSALVLTSAVLAGPWIASQCFSSKRLTSVVMGIASMFLGGLLVHFGQGPFQIEMHFYFFVLIALLSIFANPMVIIAAAVTAALHHLVLWCLLPSSVFNYEAPIWVVGLHALFVAFESIAASFLARNYFDNVIGLERIVRARTKEIESRNRDMKMILNSVENGFLTIDRHGRIHDERSAAVDQIFGKVRPGETLGQLVARHDADVAGWLEFGLEEVFDGIMPLELTLDQLPKRVVANHRSLSFCFYPIFDNAEELTHLTVVVTDVTAELEREKLEAEAREMLAMVEKIVHDRVGILEFFHEAGKTIDSLRSDRRDLIKIKRDLHTLKGKRFNFWPPEARQCMPPN